MNYKKEAEKYRPREIKTLLIGEAPPPNKKVYFYLPLEKIKNNKIREQDSSLSSTIFYHYFNAIPKSKKDYIRFLNKLKKSGIFLMDMYDKPLKIRGNKKNQKIIIDSIPKLKVRIKKRGILIEDRNIIFLLARQGYKLKIKKYFKNSKMFRWKEFRIKK